MLLGLMVLHLHEWLLLRSSGTQNPTYGVKPQIQSIIFKSWEFDSNNITYSTVASPGLPQCQISTRFSWRFHAAKAIPHQRLLHTQVQLSANIFILVPNYATNSEWQTFCKYSQNLFPLPNDDYFFLKTDDLPTTVNWYQLCYLINFYTLGLLVCS